MWYVMFLSLSLGRNRAPGTTVNLQRLTLELSQELLLLMTDPTTSWLVIILVLVLVILAASAQQADMDALGVDFFGVLALGEVLRVDNCYSGGVNLCDELFLLVLVLGFGGGCLVGLVLDGGGFLLFDLGGILVGICFRWRGSGGVGGWGNGRSGGCGTFN